MMMMYCSGVRAVCQALVILYLLAGLAWTITGFYWIFSSRQQPGLECGHDSLAYWVSNQENQYRLSISGGKLG